MDYPVTESNKTARFWANASQIPGIRTNGQYYGGYSKSAEAEWFDGTNMADEEFWREYTKRVPPAEKNIPGVVSYLYEIGSDSAADAINDLVRNSDQKDPWWRNLITALFNPEGAIKNEIMYMVGKAEDAADDSQKFWHEHNFRNGDRIFIDFDTDYPGGENTNYRIGCSVIGSNGYRLTQNNNTKIYQSEMIITSRQYSCSDGVGYLKLNIFTPPEYKFSRKITSISLPDAELLYDVTFGSGNFCLVIAPGHLGDALNTLVVQFTLQYSSADGDTILDISGNVAWSVLEDVQTNADVRSLGSSPSLNVVIQPDDPKGAPHYPAMALTSRAYKITVTPA